MDPSSLLVAAKAAMHGIYNTVKHRYAKAETGVKIVCKAALKPASLFVWVSTLSVETTLSFAVIPVTSAVLALQSSNQKKKKI